MRHATIRIRCLFRLVPSRNAAERGRILLIACATFLSWAFLSWGCASRHAALAAGDAWGNLTARFVYDGQPEPPKKVVLNKDVEYCSLHHPVQEQLLVDSETRGIANVVVWLKPGRGETVPVPPELKRKSEEPVRLDNKHCRFEPRVRVLHTKQPLLVGNQDAVAHNANGFLRLNAPFNDLVKVDDSVQKSFSRAEPVPVKVSCSIHAWMTAWLVIQDHPYVAVSDADGKLELPKLPTGEWTFRAWHESAGLIGEVTHDGATAQWKRGEFVRTIESGDNDLGEFLLAPQLFGK